MDSQNRINVNANVNTSKKFNGNGCFNTIAHVWFPALGFMVTWQPIGMSNWISYSVLLTFFCKHNLVVEVHPLLLSNINMQKMSLLVSCGCVVQRICLSEKRDITNIWLWFSPIGLHWWCALLDEEMYLRYIQTKELKQAGCVRKRRPINLNCLGHKKL